MRPGRNRAGLTLLEVLCALAIVAAVMVAIMGALSVSLRILQRSQQAMRLTRVAGALERVLRRDLEGAVALSEEGYRAFVGSNSLTGAAESDAGTTFLEFFSTSSLTPPDRRPNTGLVRVEYLLRRGDETGQGYELFRRERAYLPGKSPERGRSLTELLAGGIVAWEIEFNDGIEWRDEWRKDRLPQAVRVRFALQRLEDGTPALEELVFASAADRTEGPLPRN